MLSIFGGKQKLCTGSRRDFLTIGGLSFGCGGLSLAGVLRQAEGPPRRRHSGTSR